MGSAASTSGDSAAFRLHSDEKIVPLPDTLTYEATFNDHWFLNSEPETGKMMDVVGGFGMYVPTSDQKDVAPRKLLACFLKSDLDGKKRTLPMNLLVALDVSGSMMDTLVPPKTEEEIFTLPSKLAIAQKSLSVLLDQLGADDRFGLVTFAESSRVVFPFQEVSKLDKGDTKEKISGIRAGGGTSLMSAMVVIEKEIEAIKEKLDPAAQETRIVFITDMLDNDKGSSEAKGFFEGVKRLSDNFVFTTILGVGIDFNTTLTAQVTKTRGANCLSVFSEEEFLDKLSRKFSFSFFPFAFDLNLRVSLSGEDDRYAVTKVFGSPFSTRASKPEVAPWTPETHVHYPKWWKQLVWAFLLSTRRAKLRSLPTDVLAKVFSFIAPPVVQLAEINTIFPSEVKQGHIYGGAFLLEIEDRKMRDNEREAALRKPEKIQATLRVTYKDRSGRERHSDCSLNFTGLLDDFSFSTSNSSGLPVSSTATSTTSTSSPSTASKTASPSMAAAVLVSVSKPTPPSFYSHEIVKKAIYLQRYVEATQDFLIAHHEGGKSKDEATTQLRELWRLFQKNELTKLSHPDFAETVVGLRKFISNFCQ